MKDVTADTNQGRITGNLVKENERDQRYWIRLNSTINHFKLPIDTWATGGGKGK